MTVIISYIRVSTQQQGRSGLGLEAQQADIARFAAASGAEIAAEYVEVETGKGADALESRPQLAAALAHARKIGATIVVAKLDRLTRNVEFGAGLMNRKVNFKVVAMPHADNFQLHLFLALAEQERDVISARTKAALAAAKARGAVLGNAALAKANADAAQAFAESLREIVEPVLCRSIRQIAAYLNERGIATATGSAWRASNVARLIDRLKGETYAEEAAQAA
ncbi:recombinase family protein [Bradyrhizobium liaoningense]|uniref:recombinase family protein n=1 Tax=Bradyrhizobium liaoningense TaxID=43992 RepID=UPI001BA6F51B|nr:recombinase family protein [Bradyrhizobium liaoningense]MBR0741180.1 recombinase family protein [Bradyrhizobium liaoningense]